MRTELVSIPTSGTPLDGALYSPSGGSARGGVLLMHGNGSNFYTGPSRFLPPYLAEAGFTCLAFNRHGHETLTTRTRQPEGNAYQTAAEAIADNVAAANFLAALGHGDPVVIGHSNGGLLASRHASDHPGTPALILLSAHAGGREMLPRASALGLLAGDHLEELARHARDLVAAGRPDELMLLPGWWYVSSAGSFVDMLENLPALLDSAARIQCPALFLRGDREDRELYPAERFAEAAPGPVDLRILADCDHFYTGHEKEVSQLIVDWLTSALDRSRTGDPG